MTTTPDILDLLRREGRAIADEVARLAGSDDKEAVIEVLNRLTLLHAAREELSAIVADNAPPVVKQALKIGIDQYDLYDRPYSDTKVRRIAKEAKDAKELDMPARRSGPRRRVFPPAMA